MSEEEYVIVEEEEVEQKEEVEPKQEEKEQVVIAEVKKPPKKRKKRKKRKKKEVEKIKVTIICDNCGHRNEYEVADINVIFGMIYRGKLKCENCGEQFLELEEYEEGLE